MKRFLPLLTLFVCLFLWQSNANAQWGCATPVVLTNNFSVDTFFVSNGNGGFEDWNSPNPSDGCGITTSYWDDDVYLYSYTTGVNAEELTWTVTTGTSYTGIGIFETCTGTNLDDCIETDGSSGFGATHSVTAIVDASTTVYLAVGQWGTPDAVNFKVDTFYAIAITCPPPSDLAAAPAVTSAMLSWTDNTGGNASDSHVEVVAGGAGQGTGTPVIAGSTTAYNATGLTAFTDYDYYVRSYCGVGDSSTWVGPFSFTTTGPGGSCGTAFSQTVETDCSIATPISIDFTSAPVIGNRSCDAVGTNYGYWYSFSAPASGAINLSASNGASAVEYEVVDGCGATPNVIACAGSLDDGDVVALVGFTPSTTYYIVYWKDSQTGSGDFCLEVESCPGLANVMAGNITATSADLSWTSTLTDFVVEWGVDGFTQGTGTLIATSSNPHTLSGLTPNTDYDFYARGVCTPNVDSTDWVGPISFSTPCAVETPDYAADFSTNPPDCWDEAGAGDPAAGPSDLGSGLWTTSTTGYTGFTNTNKINLFTTNREDWLISPEFDLTGGGALQLVVNAGITDYNSTSADPDGMTGTDDSVVVLMTTDGTTWTGLHAWDASNQPTLAGDQFIYDLTGVGLTGTVQFGIWAKDGPTDDGPDYDFHIGQFEVRVPPSCNIPTTLTATNITGTSADLGWTQLGGSAGWIVEYGDAGFTQGSGTTVAAPVNPHPLTGLTDCNTYDFYVKTVCEGDSSDWAGPFAFTTISAAPTCASIVSPMNMATDHSLTALLLFTVPDCADTIVITAGDSPGSTDTIGIFDVAGSGGDTTGIVWFRRQPSTTYYWTVTPSNDFGSATCTEMQFTTQDAPPTSSGASCAGGFSESYKELFSATPAVGWTGDIITSGTGWDASKIGGTTSTDTGPDGAGEGSYYMYYEATGSSPGDSMEAISPLIDLSTSSAADVAFLVHMNGRWMGDLDISYSTSATGPWTHQYSIKGSHQDSIDDAWMPIALDASSMVGGDLYVRLLAINHYGSFESDMAIDSFVVRGCVSCIAPTDLAAANITAATADLSWTDNTSGSAINAVVEIVASGAGQGSGTPVSAGSITMYSATGLTSFTDYDYYVRTVCAVGDSSTWSGPFAFTTLGPGASCSLAIPQTVEADCSTATPISIDFSTSPVIGDRSCDAAGTNYGLWYSFTAPATGAVTLSASNGATSIEYEVVDGCGATPNVIVCAGSLDDGDAFEIGGLTPSATYYIVYWKDSQTTSGDFCLEVVSCPNIANEDATNIMATSADLSWTSTLTDFIVEWGPTGFTQGTGTLVATTMNPYALSGLTAATEYDYYVRGVCTPNVDSTDWAGPVTFTTSCLVYTPDYIEEFNSFVPTCWTEFGNTAGGEWSGDDWANDTGAPNGLSAKINMYDLEQDTLMSPEFDLSSGGPYELEYHIADAEWNSTTLDAVWDADDSVTLAITTDGGVSWTGLEAYSALNPAGIDGVIDTIDLAAYSGTVQFAFIAVSTTNTLEDIDVFVDSFHIYAVSSDPCPTSLHVTGSPVSGTLQADVSITSDATISSPEDVIFKAGTEITLGDDGSGGAAEFEVEAGAVFETIMDPCAVSPAAPNEPNDND